jgi:GNAT superfamily N-acetyltransferase
MSTGWATDLDAVLDEVHRSNMTRLDRDGRPVRRTDGKVVRSDLYRPPDVAASSAGRSPSRRNGVQRPSNPDVTANPLNIIVRVTGQEDLPALAALRRAWAEEQGDEPGVDDEFEQRFAGWYEAEQARRVTWIAEVDGRPAGMVNVATFERMPWPGRPPSRWGYLGNAFVPASYRGQGIGERLVAALLEYADAEGLVRVVLSPSARSVSLYEPLGFGAAHMLMARVRRAEDQSVH